MANKVGMKASVIARQLGDVFIKVASGDLDGQLIDINNASDIDHSSEIEHMEFLDNEAISKSKETSLGGD